MRENTELFTKLWNADELHKLLDLFADDAIIMPPGAPAVHGKEGIKSTLQPLGLELGSAH